MEKSSSDDPTCLMIRALAVEAMTASSTPEVSMTFNETQQAEATKTQWVGQPNDTGQ